MSPFFIVYTKPVDSFYIPAKNKTGSKQHKLSMRDDRVGSSFYGKITASPLPFVIIICGAGINEKDLMAKATSIVGF